MAARLVLIALTCCYLNQRCWVASYQLTITPDHVRASKEPQNVTFNCAADVSLTGCQFRWWDYYTQAGPPLDLSQGSQSKVNSSHLNDHVTGYSYNGRGLAAGDCGVSLQVEGYKLWMVACRVEAEDGVWKYAWTDLFAASRDPYPNTVTPREVVGLSGGELSLIVKADGPLGGCSFYLPGESYSIDLDQGAESTHSTGRHSYHGTGLMSGECGLSLANLTEEDNGPAWGWIRNTAWTKDDYRCIALIVESPPTAPELHVTHESDHVTATCTVQRRRDVIEISWLLDNEAIRQDSFDDSPYDPLGEWLWPWMPAPLTQRLVFRLLVKHYGKVLTCRVSHPTLSRTLEASHKISFDERANANTTLRNNATSVCVTTCTSVSPSVNLSTGVIPNIQELFCVADRWRSSREDVDQLQAREALAGVKAAELTQEAARSSAKAAATASEVAVEVGKVLLEAAKASLEAARSSAKAEESRAKNAEEQLQFERMRRRVQM